MRLGLAPISQINVWRQDHEAATSGVLSAPGERNGFGSAERGDASDDGSTACQRLDARFQDLLLLIKRESSTLAQ